MNGHDIIDNQNFKLSDAINQVLESSESAMFAVGYFFLSGFDEISDKLNNLHEVKLLIGNTSNHDTVEILAEGYKRLELVEEELERQQFRKRTDAKGIAYDTSQDIRSGMELMDQTKDAEELIATIIKMIEEKRLKVRIYTRGRLHSKAYIFNYGQLFDALGRPVQNVDSGIGIVGSSNLSLAGVTHNTELNVIVRGSKNHEELTKWFNALWEDSEDFDESLMHEMKQSWAQAEVTPYDIYMKTLFTLVKDRLDGAEDKEILFDDDITEDLAEFQRKAVKQAIQIIKDYGGVFIADVVGLGKSFIGAAVLKHFEKISRARPLIICPPSLKEMWEFYNETYQLNAKILSMGLLVEHDGGNITWLQNEPMYKDRDFLLIDESHNFRHSETQRYQVVQQFLGHGKRCCFLTATPRNKSAWDIYNQIKLFQQDDKTDIPVDPPNLKRYFDMIEVGERNLQELLRHVQIRRLRNHVLKWYGYDSETHQKIDLADFEEYKNGKRKAYVLVGGKHNYFPKRELKTVQYSIESTYQGLYQQIRNYLVRTYIANEMEPPQDKLTFARYGLWHYVTREKRTDEPYASLKRAGSNLNGLIRILLFKRFESSVYAFKCTVKKLLVVHERFLKALEEGIMPAGDEAQDILYEPNYEEEQDIIDALRGVSEKYKIDDFDSERLMEHIEHDIDMFRKILFLVEPITPNKDAKLQELKKLLNKSPLREGKKIIFTQYADTAQYLYENLKDDFKNDDIDVIYGSDRNKMSIVARFSPKSNPQFSQQKQQKEINTLVATDVLSEGLNLQDCDKIVNYDLHWNPVKLIQRFGRIDRIGSEHEVVYGFNFLPEAGIETNLGLSGILKNRIQEIHDTIGEDSAILDPSERINEDAMYAIYDLQMVGDLEPDDDIIDLNEAEEMFRQMKKDKPEEYKRIANIRDGVRSSKQSNRKGFYIFCQAGRYQQLYLVNESGSSLSREVQQALKEISCSPDTPTMKLHQEHNKIIMLVKSQFNEEVKQRLSELKHSVNLTVAQKYVLRELKILFENTENSDLKSQINIIEKAFREHVNAPLNRELNRLRKNGLVGEILFDNLKDIYFKFELQNKSLDSSIRFEDNDIPKIICSESLI